MNQKQRKVLFIISALIILMFLFPPYVIRGGESGNLVYKSGYGCVFDLPQGGDYRFAATVNVSFLLAQIFGVLVVGGIFGFAFRGQQVEKAS
jgi:hypothetical protein